MTHADYSIAPTPDVVIAALDAAQLLCEQGWCRGVGTQFTDGRRCYCAVAALSKSCHTVRLEGRLIIPGAAIFSAAYEALRYNVPPGYPSVSQYNDAATKDAVITMYLRAKDTVRKSVAA